jgi:hypothetical protein
VGDARVAGPAAPRATGQPLLKFRTVPAVLELYRSRVVGERAERPKRAFPDR